MIYSRAKITWVFLFIVIFYLVSIHNIQSIINYNLTDFSHMEICQEVFLGSQRLSFNMSIFTIVLLMGFEHRYDNIYRFIRANNNETIFTSIFMKGIFIAIFVALNAIAVQLITLPIGNIAIDLQALFFTLVIILTYVYSVYSLYITYFITFKHIVSLSAVALYRMLLVLILGSLNFSVLDFQPDVLFYIYIGLEIIVTNIIIVYLSNKKERLVL